MALQLGHEALAETHDLHVRLAFGVEVRAALAAAHGQRRQRILEGLLEGKELQDAQVNARVEADTALVGAYGAVHLHAVALVYHDLAGIIHPRYAEHHHALGLDDTLQNLHLDQLGIFQNVGSNTLHNLVHGLVELSLARVLGHDVSHETVDVLFY